jgi:hypothetical protein
MSDAAPGVANVAIGWRFLRRPFVEQAVVAARPCHEENFSRFSDAKSRARG